MRAHNKKIRHKYHCCMPFSTEGKHISYSKIKFLDSIYYSYYIANTQHIKSYKMNTFYLCTDTHFTLAMPWMNERTTNRKVGIETNEVHVFRHYDLCFRWHSLSRSQHYFAHKSQWKWILFQLKSYGQCYTSFGHTVHACCLSIWWFEWATKSAASASSCTFKYEWPFFIRWVRE